MTACISNPDLGMMPNLQLHRRDSAEPFGPTGESSDHFRQPGQKALLSLAGERGVRQTNA
jgi:hypothetical protein